MGEEIELDLAIEAATAVTGIDRERMLGSGRTKRVVEARHILCWVLHETFRWPYAAIGRRLDRDHTTIMSAVKRVRTDGGTVARAAQVAATRAGASKHLPVGDLTGYLDCDAADLPERLDWDALAVIEWMQAGVPAGVALKIARDLGVNPWSIWPALRINVAA